jgi:hypothetical protein
MDNKENAMSNTIIAALCALPLAISGVVALSACILGSRISRLEERRQYVVAGIPYHHHLPEPLVASELTRTGHATYNHGHNHPSTHIGSSFSPWEAADAS